MSNLNDRMTALEAERFVTMTAIVLDYVNHRATILIAGHMPPILLKTDKTIEEPGEDDGGPPLAIMSEIPYESTEIELKPGESLTLYTDGVFEAPNAQGAQYSIERLRTQVRKMNGDIEATGQEIISQVQKHIEGCDQEDDMCLVIIGRDAS